MHVSFQCDLQSVEISRWVDCLDLLFSEVKLDIGLSRDPDGLSLKHTGSLSPPHTHTHHSLTLTHSHTQSVFAFLDRTKMKFSQLFGRLKSVVIGMIHVQALPGKALLRTISF